MLNIGCFRLNSITFAIVLLVVVGGERSPPCSVPHQDYSYCKVTEVGSLVCKIKDVCQLQSLIPEPANITNLDLSHNHIQIVPNKSLARYTGFKRLSLAYNHIQVLAYEAFYGLDNLTTLNISMNPLHTFTGNLRGLLPSLSLLDATGIVGWKPEKQLLQLRMLQRILSLSWSAECKNCLFYRTNKKLSIDSITSDISNCYIFTYLVTNLSPIVQFLSNTSFKVRCENTRKCTFSEYYKTHINATNDCWEETLIGINFQSVLGVLGVFLNLVVFVNILISKTLRKNISMLFVCNMACSDFLLSVYIICITAYLNGVSFNYVNDHSGQHCWKIGFLWMLGQMSSVITVFFLTLERYLAIVYTLQPDIRITRKMAMIMISICWLVAILVMVYALYFNFYRFTFLCIPLRLAFRTNLHGSIFSIIVSGIALILFLTTFIFYIHIFVTVKRAAQNAGVERESKLAKRIALLVFSNFVFFFLPVLILGIVLAFGLHLEMIRKFDKIVFAVIGKVLPAFCLSLNSFLNPVLHAFRNDRFIQALKERFQYFRQHIGSLVVLPERQSNSRVGPETQTTNLE